MKIIPTIELIETFAAGEGSINLYYGLIGNGKTYNATADILDLLSQGFVIYANWRIIVSDYDERQDIGKLISKTLFFKKRFYKIPQEKNLHYFDAGAEPDDPKAKCQCGKTHAFRSMPALVEWLSSLNDCEIFFDEGQDMFDSYEGTNFSKIKRRMILHTRHYHRTLNIITQRPTAIQVSARGNVNRFYKCVKIATWPWPRFARYEFQEMSKETVDEEQEPISTKTYWASSRVFKAYNTSYLAQGIPKSQAVHVEGFELTIVEKIKALWNESKKRASQFYSKLPMIQRNRQEANKSLPASKGQAIPKNILGIITPLASKNDDRTITIPHVIADKGVPF